MPWASQSAQGKSQPTSRNQIDVVSSHAAAQSAKLSDVPAVGGGDHPSHAHREKRLGDGMGVEQQG